MDKKNNIFENKIIKRILLTIGFILFVYLMIAFNLGKITKSFEPNIFKSPGLGKLFIYFVILFPIAVLIEYMFNKDNGDKDTKSNADKSEIDSR